MLGRNSVEFDFLGELPIDDHAYEALKGAALSPLNDVPETVDDYLQPLTEAEFKEDMRGVGQEFGECKVVEDDLNVINTNYLPKTPTEASFDPRLVFEIALAMESPDIIYPRYQLDQQSWISLNNHPVFQKAVAELQKDLAQNGTTFRMKARVQAEAYLKDAHMLVKSPDTSATVKANMIQWVTKVADLEPQKAANSGFGNFQLNIHLG